LANNISELGDTLPPDWTTTGTPTIPKGTSFQDAMTKLFFKEVYGTAVWYTPSWSTSPAQTNPQVTFDKEGSTHEVGTVLTPTITAGTATGGTRVRTCTCSQGYFTSNDKDAVWTQGNYSESKNGSVSGDNTYSWKLNNTALSSYTTVTVGFGENNYSITQSGKSSTAEKFDEVTLYPSTNTKKIINTPSKSPEDTDATKRLSSTCEVQVIGKYKVFYYTSPTTSTDVAPKDSTSAFLNTSGITTLSDINVEKGNHVYICIPEEYSITKVTDAFGTDITETITQKNGTFTYNLPNNTTHQYKIYTGTNNSGNTWTLQSVSITYGK
jgi:hypothetical protein